MRRYNIEGRVYPCIAKAEESSVSGSLFVDLSDREKDIANEFEDEWYERAVVEVEPLDSVTEYDILADSPVQALAFIGTSGVPAPLHGTWSYEYFREHHLNEFVNGVREFADELMHEWGEKQ